MSRRLDEGWYLMSSAALERLLHGSADEARGERITSLTTEEALAYRNAGNLPDEMDRSLRLVLHMHGPEDLMNLQRKRLQFEPDFHEAPRWRRPGSRPVNVVPLRVTPFEIDAPGQWLDDDELRLLEAEWSESGRVAGVNVPQVYRGFVYKTVLELRAAGIPVTPESIAGSIARWLPPEQVDEVERALREANPPD